MNSEFVSKKIFFGSIFFCLFICLLISSIVLYDKSEYEPLESVSSESADSDFVAADSFSVMFVLRNIDGNVAVLNSLESNILEILDISCKSLPQEFRDELEGGLCVGSVTELVYVVSELWEYSK